jgi:hypothetical protein
MGIAFDAIRLAKGIGAKKESSSGISMEGTVLFFVLLAGGAIGSAATRSPGWVIAGALTGVYFLVAIKVADQWEKAAVLRLGRYKGLRGPGLFFVIPVIDRISDYVDQRIRVTDVSAESSLTRDTVPVNVDVIVFWVVWTRRSASSRSKISGRPFR